MSPSVTKFSVVVTGHVLPILPELLQPAADLSFFPEPRGKDHAAFLAALQQADGLISSSSVTVDETLLNQAPQLKVISQPSVGVDNIDLAACTKHQIPVGHTPGVLVEATADIAFGLLLNAARRIPEGWNFVRSGSWGKKQSLPLGVDLYGKTLGIVGMGRIGTAVARRACASGLSVIYHNRHPRTDESTLQARYVAFDELVKTSDFIILLLPLTKESTGLFNAAVLAKMKPTAYLINAARGKIVDSAALYQALKSGQIAFAAMDVTDPEPLPADHPLLTLPNILITPHIGSATTETRDAMARLAAKNLLLGLQGKSLAACANPKTNFTE